MHYGLINKIYMMLEAAGMVPFSRDSLTNTVPFRTKIDFPFRTKFTFLSAGTAAAAAAAAPDERLMLDLLLLLLLLLPPTHVYLSRRVVPEVLACI